MKTTLKQLLDERLSTISKDSPMMSYMWFLELPKIDGDDNDTSMIDLSSRISSVNTPFLQYETDKEKYGNSFWYYSKSVDIGNLTFEIIEMEDGKTRDYLERWQSMMLATIDPYSAEIHARRDVVAFNPPNVYKRNLYMYRLDTLKNTVYFDKYSGYFISGIEEISSDYESSGFLKYSVTLTGDNISYKSVVLNKEDGIRKQITPLEVIADRVENVTDFFEKVTHARTSARSIIDILG